MNCIKYMDGKAYLEREMMEVTIEGRKHKVWILTENDAKAKISEEYGFEFNSIRIEDACWYEATDMNHFRFSVKGWQYQIDNYGLLEVLY